MPLCLTLSDPDGNSILVSGAVPEAARSKETTEEMVRQSLSKLGGTPYYLKKANISLGGGLGGSGVGAQPSPAGSSGKALSQKKPSKNNSFFCSAGRAAARAHPEKSPALWVRLQYPGQLDRELWRQVQRIILPLDQLASLPVTGLEEKLVAQLPPMLFCEEKLLRSLSACYDKGIRYAMTGNLGGILPVQKLGCRSSANFGLNVTNSQSLIRLKEMGLAAATLSIEMPIADCTAMAPVFPEGFSPTGGFL